MNRFPELTPASVFVIVTALAMSGCGMGAVVESEVPALDIPLPQALVVGCANPPNDLEAEMWISGFAESCPLDVDIDAGTTTGDCVVTTGRERTLTIDWFVTRGGTRVLLAQSRQRVDLTNVTEENVAIELGDGDIEVMACLDVREDQRDGVDTQRFDGEDRPVCDLDNDCGGTLEVGCSNIGEVCANADPLVP